MSQIVTRNTREADQTPPYIRTDESDITREQNADLTSKKRTSTKHDKKINEPDLEAQEPRISRV
jgi:hypothetical protein